MSNKRNKKGLLLVISGPSGAGKGTIHNAVIKECPFLKKSISVTTRSPRVGEQEGVHYYFKSVEQFMEMKNKGEFLESAEVYKNFYGTPKAPVMKILDNGDDVIFEIDICGARQIKNIYPESILIFVMPPSFEVLEKRLRGRGTDAEDVILRRLSQAKSELATYKEFDYFVVNDDIQKSIDDVVSIIKSEKCKVKRNVEFINEILDKGEN